MIYNSHQYAWRKTIDVNFVKYTIWNLISAVSFFFLAEREFKLTILQSILVSIAVIVAIFAYRYIYYKIEYYNSTVRENIYGEAIIILKDAFSQIHLLRNQEMTNENFMTAMQAMCDNLKKIFDKKTKSDCAVSIKVPVNTERMHSQSRILNICRDKESVHRQTQAYMSKVHSVFNNTCFNVIIDNLQYNERDWYYINNNIPRSIDYANTSKTTYKAQILPYKSELVVPIIPQIWSDGEDVQALGFLCVDSDKTHSFDNRYDLGILEGVAEGIYDIIKLRNSIKGAATVDQANIQNPIPNNAPVKSQTHVLKNRDKSGNRTNLPKRKNNGR
jgi:hypothetical protein